MDYISGCVTKGTGDIMLEVEEIEEGVYKVTLDEPEHNDLEKLSVELNMNAEVLLAFWIGTGRITVFKMFMG